jgi:hypothetical protein
MSGFVAPVPMMVQGRGCPVPTTFAGLADSGVGANADRIADFSHAQGEPDRSGGAIDAKLTVLTTRLSFIGSASPPASPGSCPQRAAKR